MTLSTSCAVEFSFAGPTAYTVGLGTYQMCSLKLHLPERLEIQANIGQRFHGPAVWDIEAD